MPGGRGKEQSICLPASPSVLLAASAFTSEALARVTNRLRMHLEGLPRVAQVAHGFYFYEFSLNFLAYRPTTARTQALRAVSHTFVSVRTA